MSAEWIKEFHSLLYIKMNLLGTCRGVKLIWQQQEAKVIFNTMEKGK